MLLAVKPTKNLTLYTLTSQKSLITGYPMWPMDITELCHYTGNNFSKISLGPHALKFYFQNSKNLSFLPFCVSTTVSHCSPFTTYPPRLDTFPTMSSPLESIIHHPLTDILDMSILPRIRVNKVFL